MVAHSRAKHPPTVHCSQLVVDILHNDFTPPHHLLGEGARGEKIKVERRETEEDREMEGK